MNWWLPLAATAVVAALTYFCCVRPMMPSKGRRTVPQAGSDSFEARVTQLQADLERFRTGDSPTDKRRWREARKISATQN